MGRGGVYNDAPKSPFGTPISDNFYTGGGFERAVRPFESKRVAAIRAKREASALANDDGSTLRWGKAIPGSADGTTPAGTGSSVSISNPAPEKKPPDTNKPVRVYTEVSRKTETVRVFSATDSSQYVDVARIKSILFNGPDGAEVRFDLRPPK